MPDANREPVAWLNYSGRVEINPLVPMGPNTLGEWLWPVAAEYDAKKDRTRVGLSHIAPTEAAPQPVVGSAWAQHFRRSAFRRSLLGGTR
jgi:hypothetical protein